MTAREIITRILELLREKKPKDAERFVELMLKTGEEEKK